MARPLNDQVRDDVAKLLNELGQKGVRFIRPLIPSRTLQKSLRYDVELKKTVFKLNFSVPQYWAKFVHDGRSAPFLTENKMIWYANPGDDPRIKNGYPVKRSDVQKLTRQEYLDGVLTNREMYRDFPEGGTMQFMIITDFIKKTTGAQPFFDVGLKGFGNTVRKAVRRKITRRLKTNISLKTRTINLRL